MNEWNVGLNHIVYTPEVVDQIIFSIQLTGSWFLKKTHGEHFLKREDGFLGNVSFLKIFYFEIILNYKKVARIVQRAPVYPSSC